MKRFLETFHPAGADRNVDEDDEAVGDAMDLGEDMPKYMAMIRQCARRQRIRLPVYVDDLLEFFAGDLPGLAVVTGVENNTQRYVVIFCEQVDALLKERFRDDVRFDTDDVSDVYVMHRSTVAGEDEHAYPASLMRRYELSFVPRALQEPLALRNIRSEHIGHLVKTRGIVVRASELMPQIVVATYVCDRCAGEIYQEVVSKVYMPLTKCPGSKCAQKTGNKGGPGTLHMQTRGSRFVKFQEVRIQELPEEVPVGHVPRSIACQVRGENTRRVSPGDVVSLDGVFLPAPFQGYQAMGAGLITDTFMNVMQLRRQLKSYSEYKLTPALLAQVDEASRSPDAYTRLAMSIAPEIYGHLDVKKALLLMMVGGVTRNMPDGMMIRGDINVCLIGDPGVAKSQLLKHIAHIAPRGIYTSGKGSSGVGLTAAVMKVSAVGVFHFFVGSDILVQDPVSGEFVLEGGSLVLADMGICCIDEFDKMADADRTSIHEVMEQQSISIAKAGITCSLNARAAILAAANPAFGRYDTRRTPSENINLPAALLSRFDLLFLLLDKPSWERDMALAKHIAYVHIHSAPPELEFEPYSSEFLRSYIAKAKSFEPFVPDHLSDHIVSAYVNMREIEVKDMENAKTYTTARTLLAILRLSQALAKLKFAEEVTSSDVDEAIRLMNSSKSSLVEDAGRTAGAVDTMSAIYDIIRSAGAATEATFVSYDDVLQRALRKGYRQEDVQRTVQQYEELGVWMVSLDKTQIQFV